MHQPAMDKVWMWVTAFAAASAVCAAQTTLSPNDTAVTEFAFNDTETCNTNFSNVNNLCEYTYETGDPGNRCYNLNFAVDDNKGSWSLWFTDKGLERIVSKLDECSVSSTREQMYIFESTIVSNKLWKQNMVQVFMKIRNASLGEHNTTYHYFRNLRLLRSSKESEFIYLPLQIEHFSLIQQFMSVYSLYEESRSVKSTPLNVTMCCAPNIPEDTREYLLTSHLTFLLTFGIMPTLLYNGSLDEEHQLDSVCLSSRPGYTRRGVPYEIEHCCSTEERNVFESDKTHSTILGCEPPTGSVFTIRKYTLALVTMLLLIFPLIIVCFPGRPEPYKVLRDTTRRGHRLYTSTDRDRRLYLVDGDYTNNAKVIEVQEDVNEQEELVKRESKENGDVIPEEVQLAEELEMEELPAIVKEGKDFRNELPDRLYLDSDPEFHLNLHIVISYLLLFHIDSHILMVVRRLVILYLLWVMIGFGTYVYYHYYPVLLEEPILDLESEYFIEPLFLLVNEDYGEVVSFRFFTYMLPAVCTAIVFILLSPIFLRKRPISETLHCGGDLRFFGDPFPESIVEMKHLRRTPKPSKPWTYELLLYRNMLARVTNLGKLQFWKLFWQRWICRGCRCRREDSPKTVLDYVLIVFWLPVSMVLLVLHVVPLFSVWANYVRKEAKLVFGFTEKHVGIVRRVLKVPLFFVQIFGILFMYLMMWHLLLIGGQFVVFVFIDILRNAATTLSKIILILAIMMYLRGAFQDFEDGYRDLKMVTFEICTELAEKDEEEDTFVVVRLLPHEPLYVRTNDGEASIPRRIFYDICKTYRPYTNEVAATFFRLFFSFALMIVIFALIVKFQIFEEFSEVGETMLTVATATLPSVLGVLKSSSHQGLSDQRRNSHIRTWLEKITVTRKVNVNLEKPTKRVVSTC